MLRSIYAGVSGLGANTIRLDVIGNNIANVNTVGFKSSRATFQEMAAQMLRSATGPNGEMGGSNPAQVGLGSRLGSIDGVFSQGGLETTGVGTDLAIQGSAFFVLGNGPDATYTRSGSFQLDGQGNLVHPGNGMKVQGFAATGAEGEFASQTSALRLPLGEPVPARGTGEITYRGNLNADSEPLGSIHQSAIFRDPSGAGATGATALVDLRADVAGAVSILEEGDTIDFGATVGGISVSGTLAVDAATTLDDLAAAVQAALAGVEGGEDVEVSLTEDGRIRIESPDAVGRSARIGGLSLRAVDAAGETRDAFNGVASMSQVQEARDAGNFIEETTVYDSLGFAHVVRLEFTRVLDANEFTWKATVDGGETQVLSGGSGRVTFNPDGSLNGFSFDAAGESLASKLTIAPGSGASVPLEIDLAPGSAGGFGGITMLNGETTLEAGQDGSPQGTLLDFRIDRSGEVVSIYSNGVTRSVGKLALAEFVNPSGLSREGDSIFRSTFNSGDARVGMAGASVEAEIFSGTLEQSNVDLAREFTNMILAQRGFQASARVISTSEEVLTELLNIKR